MRGEMRLEYGGASRAQQGILKRLKKITLMLRVFTCGRANKLLPITLSALLVLSTAAIAAQIGPNPNNGMIDTPIDFAMPPVPNPPAVTASNGAGVTFTNNGTVNFWGSFDNNGTINNNGTMTDILQCINHNNNAGAVWNNNAGAHMDIGNGLLNNAAGATFNNYGDFNTGSLGGSIINYGTLTNHAGGYYFNGVQTQNYNTFVNNGTYEGWIFHNYAGTVTNNGTWIHHSGIIDNAARAIFNNNGTMTTDSWYGSTFGIYNNGTFNNNAGAVITNGAGITSYNLAVGTFNNAGTITNYGTVRNDAGATFNNSGILTNSTGATINNAGTLNIATGGSLNNSGTFHNTGTLEFAAGSLYDFTNGTLNNNSGGTLKLYRKFTLGEAANGALNLNAGSTLQNYAVLINPEGNTQTSNGGLVNSAGAVFMNNGTMNGSGTVNNQGVLMGNGSFSGNVTNSGTMAPGTSIGTMTIGGNFFSSASAVYEVEVNAAGQSDKLNVTGTATLNGGTVSVLGADGAYRLRTDYIILTAGNILGGFANVTDNLAFLDPSLRYDQQNVYLTLTRNATRFGDAVGPSGEGLTPNQKAVADSLDIISPAVAQVPLTEPSDMRSVIDAIIPMTWGEYVSALDQMGGLVHTTIGEVTFSSFHRYMGAINSRMGGFIAGGPSMSFSGQQAMLASRTGNLSDAGNTLLAAMNNSGMAESPSWGLWGQGYGNIGDRRGEDISSRYNYDTAGGVIGFDRQVSAPLLLGVSIGYSQGDVRMKDLSERADISSLHGSLYGIYTSGPWYAGSVLAYGFNSYDTERNMAFGGLSRKATADYNAHSMGAYLEGGVKIKTRDLDIIPSASLTASHIIRESFNEEGAGALSLNAEEERSSYVLSSLGVKFMKECAASWGVITPEFKVRWDHRLTGDLFALNAAFDGYPNAHFTTRGDMPYRDLLGVGAGISILANKNIELRLAYEGSFSGDNTEHGGTLSFRYLW